MDFIVELLPTSDAYGTIHIKFYGSMTICMDKSKSLKSICFRIPIGNFHLVATDFNPWKNEQ